jgi:hypothetical protein
LVRCTPIDEVLDWSKLELTPAMALSLHKPEANNSGVVAGEGGGPNGQPAKAQRTRYAKTYTYYLSNFYKEPSKLFLHKQIISKQPPFDKIQPG